MVNLHDCLKVPPEAPSLLLGKYILAAAMNEIPPPILSANIMETVVEEIIVHLSAALYIKPTNNSD